ncbi:MAG: response regulator transcription factor [Blautia sp.]|nr:response regulator transcription factor [Blautia sp.]
MIRVALVDDNGYDREKLKEYLERYEKDHHLQFKVTEFTDGEDIVTDYTAEYDLILLDIEMQFLNGMKAAQKIREMDADVPLVFITNMPQYAIDGYKVRALDYVLKPVSYFSLTETLGRALKHINTHEKKYITISLKGGKVRVDISEIMYVEVQDHLLIYHTVNGNYIAKGTMRDLESMFDPEQFFRCNRCYIVNLAYVDNYQGSDLVIHGDRVQISRSRKKQFLDAMNVYINGAQN